MQGMKEILDARGMFCPVPAAVTGKKLKEMHAGDVLEVLTTDDASLKDIPAVVNSLGHVLKEFRKEPSGFRFVIEVK